MKKRFSKAEKAERIAEILDELYPDPEGSLRHGSSYTLLVAVLLSAQCTDVRVNQVTPVLFARADTPEKMIALSVEEIESIIRPCGLAPRKAQAIFDLSRILLDEHDGEVPQSYEGLEALPGVGHKTASVVMAQAFGGAGISRGYAYSPPRLSMGIVQWQKCGANRAGFETHFPRGNLE